jgi:hypothetical protein
MAAAAHASDSASCACHVLPGSRAAGENVGILRRLFEAISESPWRRTEREIAAFIARRGGRITDEVEREIGRRHFTSNWIARP